MSLLLLTPFLSTVSAAEGDVAADEGTEWNVTVGAVAVYASAPWRGVDDQGGGTPYIEASKGGWRFGGRGGIAYELDVTDRLSVWTGVDYRDDGYDSDVSPVDTKSNAPVFVGYDSPAGEVIVNYGMSMGWVTFAGAQDVSGKSESHTASFSLEIPILDTDSRLKLAASVSAHWYSSDYVRYYYGIDNDQVDNRVGRFAYEPDAATNFQAGINASYQLSERWAVIGSAGRMRLDDEIVGSPLIGSDNQDILALGLVYRWLPRGSRTKRQ